MKYVIGVDLGTSATKTILVDQNGKIVAEASVKYPMYQPENGWAEQDPSDWSEAAISTIKSVVEKGQVNGKDVRGIGISGQMHGLVMLNEENQVIRRSIIWCDQRATKQVEEMLELPMAGWTAAKILWIRENEPELFAKCRHIMLPKDYVRFILTGKYATDASDASGMQMLDVKNRCWSQEILDFLKVDRELLGDVYESPEVVGNLLPKIAEKCGLSTETVVVAGGSDNACAAIGTGIVREGQAFTTIGTSSIVYTHLKKYQEIPEGALHLCCCAVPGCWHTMGGPQSAGLSIEWMKNNFCQDLIQKAEEENVSFYDKINELTKDIPIGSERLIYLPFLMGERTPHIDPKYRGAFIGLNIIHGQAHMLRAIMEGVVYSLADCNEILKKLGTEVVSMRACGGGSRSPVWRKIMADLYKCDVHTLKQEEGPAYGAAILAGVGTGIYSSIQEACDAFIEEDGITECDLKEAEEYEKFHKIYDRFYEDIKENLHALYEL